MAEEFGDYEINVPLGADWVETLTRKTNNIADDLTGKACTLQVYESVPVRDATTGLITPDPIVEITTPDYYGGSPAQNWPTFDRITALTTNGIITMRVPVSEVWVLSPVNAKRTLYYAMVLVDEGDGSVTPVVRGRLSTVPAYVVAGTPQ